MCIFNLDRSGESCNTFNDLSDILYVPNKTRCKLKTISYDNSNKCIKIISKTYFL